MVGLFPWRLSFQDRSGVREKESRLLEEKVTVSGRSWRFPAGPAWPLASEARRRPPSSRLLDGQGFFPVGAGPPVFAGEQASRSEGCCLHARDDRFPRTRLATSSALRYRLRWKR